MISEFKRLANHSLIYGISNVSNKAIAFFLLPLYTSYLTPADYGVWELLTVTTAFVSIFLQMGLGSAIFKAVLYDEEQEEEVLVSTAFYFVVLFSGVVILVLCSFTPVIAEVVLGEPGYVNLMRMLFVAALFEAASIIPLATLRIHEESFKFSAVNMGKSIVYLLLNIYFIAILKKGVEGLVVANLLQSAIGMLVLVGLSVKYLRLTFSIPALRVMLCFSLPLVPMGIAASVLSMTDRYFLRYYTSLADTGVYALSYKFGSIIGLIVSSFQVAWPSVMFSVAKRDNAKKFYARLLTYFLFGLGLVGLGLSLFSSEMLKIMATAGYYSAYQVIPIVVLGNIFLGVYFVTAVGTNLKQKTGYQALAAITAAIVHIFLNFALIPSYGTLGAASSTAVSYALMAIIACASSHKFYPIDYEWGRVVKVSSAILLSFYAGIHIDTGVLSLDVFLKVVIIAFLPFELYFFSFYSKREILIARTMLTSCIQKLRKPHGKSER